MNNKTLLWGAVAVVLIAIAGFALWSQNKAPEGAMMQKEEGPAMNGATTSASTPDAATGTTSTAGGAMGGDAGAGDAMAKKKGSYEPYAPEKLALARDGKVVLFFRASWCPTCKVLDADIKANMEKIPAGTAILDVNYDNSKDLKQKYNVTYQHTLVQVDAEGNMIAKWSGSASLAALLTQVK